MKANKRLGLPRGAKAKWGQNFLRDEKILQKIVDFAQIEEGDTVLEIGPGEGTLTKLLLEKAGRIIAVEKDERLAELLQTKFASEIKDERLKIITGDILKLEAKSLELGGKEKNLENLNSKLQPLSYKLIGNIPYYITGEIFRKFLEAENQPTSMTFVIQKEVAERIMGSHSAKASRDKKKESILSISIKAYGEPKYGGVIKAGSFSPRPKVDSAILSVRGINKERFGGITPSIPLTLRGKLEKNITEKRFFELVKKGFAHKRKLLASNLGISPDVLLELGIKEKARAEGLKVEDWLKIARHPQIK